jgi:DNA (cytosine-5)-methyltransferase 1
MILLGKIIKRFAMESPPKIIDLFSGAGGLSLGAARAGFSVWGAVETDKFALDTHSRNFTATKHLVEDVATLSGHDLLRAFSLADGEIFGIIGGPPCQGFSAIGHGRPDDPRNCLFKHFFRLIKELRPAFFLAENVTGILHAKYDAIRSAVFSNLPSQYILLPPLRIKASDYGAPTSRTRIFFLGYNPNKFKSNLLETDFLPQTFHPTICVRKALYGLPVEIASEKALHGYGWQEMTASLDDRSDFFFFFTAGHVPPNTGDKNWIARYIGKEVSGCLSTKHSSEVRARYAALACGQQDTISKSVKLDPNGLCPTLRAGTGREKGSYQAVRPIHYDVPRVITPREAARLQGFPDWFVFQPTIWHSFRQIGNSVSPIVAETILRAIYKAI